MKLKKFVAGLLILVCTGSCQMDESSEVSIPLAWGFSIEGFPVTNAYLDQLRQETEITPRYIQFYLQWPQISEPFEPITSTLEAIASAGAIPCFTWEPMTIVDGVEQATPFEKVLGGQYDAYLKEVAKQIKEWKHPLIIRFAQEMNLKRYHWGTSENDFNAHSPEIYKNMFRYIIAIFRQQGVTNAQWAFCPNVDSVPDEAWNKAKNYYPGDEFVDILGMDGYNWAITPEIAKEKQLNWTKPWVSFEQLFSGLYQQLKEISPTKPIIVFETATAERKGNSKNLWVKEALKTAKKWKLTSVIWFQANKEEDWRLQDKSVDSYVPIIQEATVSAKAST